MSLGFLLEDKLQKFDVILANPPYSISRWDRKRWSKDPFGRNIYGTPPQARADFAFLQHIVFSMSQKGRAAILLPHGVLFRDGENKLRENLVKDDKLEAVIGLAPDLFYNADMESFIMVLRSKKNRERKNKVIFINAIDQVKRSGNKNYLSNENIDFIYNLFHDFVSVEGKSYVADIDEIKKNQFLLNMSLYVKKKRKTITFSDKDAIKNWQTSYNNLHTVLANMVTE